MATHVQDQVPEGLRQLLLARIDARDLQGALAAARGCDTQSDIVADLAAALARLVHACERMANPDGGDTGYKTLAINPAGVALLHVRMGNLEEAESHLARIASHAPSDHVSRQRLDDLRLLRSVLATPGSQERTPGLDKRRRPSSEGWKAATTDDAQSESDEDRSTEVIHPDTNAELLLRAGLPARALEVYRGLIAKNPDRLDWVRRAAEIETMIETADSPDNDRPTVHTSEPPPNIDEPPSSDEPPSGDEDREIEPEATGPRVSRSISDSNEKRSSPSQVAIRRIVRIG